MSDRIFLDGMVFEGRHGVSDQERAERQPFEVDLEVRLDLAAAGAADDLDQTVDYGELFETCRRVVEDGSFHLLEGIAEQIVADVLAGHPRVDSLEVTVRKPGVPIDGRIDWAGVTLERERAAGR